MILFVQLSIIDVSSLCLDGFEFHVLFVDCSIEMNQRIEYWSMLGIRD